MYFTSYAQNQFPGWINVNITGAEDILHQSYQIQMSACIYKNEINKNQIKKK